MARLPSIRPSPTLSGPAHLSPRPIEEVAKMSRRAISALSRPSSPLRRIGLPRLVVADRLDTGILPLSMTVMPPKGTNKSNTRKRLSRNILLVIGPRPFTSRLARPSAAAALVAGRAVCSDSLHAMPLPVDRLARLRI